MKQAVYIRVREEVKTGTVFDFYRQFLKEKQEGALTNLISSEAANTNEHEQIIGELRVVTSHLVEFQSWLDEKIRTTTNE